MKANASKKAFLGSLTALVLCFAMLIGTTFAWFTDVATTSVNTIQSGKLDVTLEMSKDGGANWEDAEGKTLDFLKAAGAPAGQKILWEPGATYELPQLRITNNGNLSLKYKIVVSGASGDTDLLDVISFSADVDGAVYAGMFAGGEIVADKYMDPGAKSIVKLSGTMATTAGNRYQDKAVTGISISVLATQATGDYDSNGNTYDDNADFTPDDLDKLVTANLSATVAAGQKTVLENTSGTVKATIPADAVADGTKVNLSVVPSASAPSGITVNDDQGTRGYEVKLVDADGNAVTPSSNVKVELFVGKGLKNLKLYHNSTEIACTYDENSGMVTFETGSFSPFTVVFQAPLMVNGGVYDDLNKALAAAANGTLYVNGDFETNNSEDTAEARITASSPLTIQLNGKIITPDNMGNNNSNFTALIVDADTTINAGENGGIDTGLNGAYAINVRKGATLTINGGSYYGGGTAIQVQKGTLIINGGFFAVEPYSNPVYGYKFLLNCIDAALKDGTARIVVTGGTFVNYDPSASDSENPLANFVAEGYHVVSKTKDNGDVWYTVTAD